MYNQAVYDQAQYNVTASAEMISLRTDAAETYTAICNVSDDLFFHTNAYESIRIEAVVNAGISLATIAEENISCAIDLAGALMLSAAATENIGFSGYLGACISMTADIEENISAIASIGANVALKARASEKVDAEVTLGGNLDLRAAAYEIYGASCSAEAMDADTIDIDVTMQPGSVLVIDSEHFLVMLDGGNAIDRHSGAWADKIDRDTLRVTIDTGNGGETSCSIMYAERWR